MAIVATSRRRSVAVSVQVAVSVHVCRGVVVGVIWTARTVTEIGDAEAAEKVRMPAPRKSQGCWGKAASGSWGPVGPVSTL